MLESGFVFVSLHECCELPPPIGNPSAVSVEVPTLAEGWDLLDQAVHDAKYLLDVASLMYKHLRLQSALVVSLGRTIPCKVRVWVYEESFREKACYYERSRLAVLHAKGALVYLCKSPGRNGCHHKKVVVTDRRTAFTGSANATNKSEKNAELVFIMKGPPVLQIRETLAMVMAAFVEWDGQSMFSVLVGDYQNTG